MDLLTTEQVRIFYDNLLTKPGYIKILRESISALKMDQILSYAGRVNREACHQLDNNIEQDSPVNLYLKKHHDFEFPAFPNELTKHCDHSGWSYKEKLNYWYETSMQVIGILTEVEPVETAQKPVTKKKIVDDKVCDIWCYAYFHLIWERNDKTKALPMYSKKEVVRISSELYKIDGNQFYNAYLKVCKVSLVDSIRKMNPKKREKLKKAVFDLAEIYDSKAHLSWWATSIH